MPKLCKTLRLRIEVPPACFLTSSLPPNSRNWSPLSSALPHPPTIRTSPSQGQHQAITSVRLEAAQASIHDGGNMEGLGSVDLSRGWSTGKRWIHSASSSSPWISACCRFFGGGRKRARASQIRSRRAVTRHHVLDNFYSFSKIGWNLILSI